jgi:hypothetical protein
MNHASNAHVYCFSHLVMVFSGCNSFLQLSFILVITNIGFIFLPCHDSYLHIWTIKVDIFIWTIFQTTGVVTSYVPIYDSRYTTTSPNSLSFKFLVMKLLSKVSFCYFWAKLISFLALVEFYLDNSNVKTLDIYTMIHQSIQKNAKLE